jgi:CDP-diacylglycerol--glycerol-3-phosphate 3-phosphatidyltransferase
MGARLDSAVDALMYSAVALSFWWLEGETIREHMMWMWGLLVSWLFSAASALIRFHRLPSYHMWSAKLAWFVTACTILLLLLTDFTAILPWTLSLVIFSNLHSVAITCTLPRWEADVWSLRQAWRIRQQRF